MAVGTGRRGRAARWLSALGLLALACGGGDEGGGAGGAPSAPRNVVLVSIDALGAAHVGAYGYPRDTTPVFDALAAEGTLFESAWSSQLWTLTSHITMLTGLHPVAHGAGRERRASPGAHTLTQILRARGFRTAAFLGTRANLRPGYGAGRGFERYEMRSPMDREIDVSAPLNWLAERAREADGRFFLFLHFYDVHSDFRTEVPYYAPEPWGHRYLEPGDKWEWRGDTALLQLLHARGDLGERDRRILTALYDGGVRYTDARGLGPIVDALRREDLLDETLLIVTADHGEELLEHGGILHEQPYREVSRVPLLLRGPGVPAGLRVDGLASLVDLTPTVLSLLGLPTPPRMQGHDLAPLLRGEAAVQDAVFVDGIQPGHAHYRSAVVADVDGGRFSYLVRVEEDGAGAFTSTGPGELYDLGADPGERHDLAAERPELAARLDARLLAWYAESRKLGASLGASQERETLSDEEREQLRGLGYAE